MPTDRRRSRTTRPATRAVIASASCALGLLGAPAGVAGTAGPGPDEGRPVVPAARPFAQVSAPCAGDRGVVTMRARRATDGGTDLTSRLRDLGHRRWYGGMYVGYDAEQPNGRFRAAAGGFEDSLASSTPWGTESIAFYVSADSRASCIVDVAATPSRVAGGADYVGLVARPRTGTLRLHALGSVPEHPYVLRVEVRTTDGRTVTRHLRVLSDESGFVLGTVTGLRALADFAQVSFTARSAGARTDRMWTVVSRGRS